MAFPAISAAISNEILNGSVGLTSFNHTIQDKLDNSNYILWRSQVLPTLRGLNLLGFVDGTFVCPPEFVVNSKDTAKAPAVSPILATEEKTRSAGDKDVSPNVSSDVSSSSDAYVMNPKFMLWIRQDQLLLSWLLSTLTPAILARVINCCSSAQVWDTLQHMHASQTQARVGTLKMQLQSTKKGVSSMADYVQKMRTIADNMAISLNPIPEAELVSHILFGLSGEYDPLVTSIYARGSAITLEKLNTLLLNHEARVNQKLEVEMSVNVASHASNGHKYSSPAKAFEGQSARNFTSNKSKFQKFHSKPKVVCQICFRPGHTAIKCYQRFNQGHVADSSNAKSALIATPYSMQDPAWYVDSGASNHLTADLNNLSLSTPYEGTDHIKVGSAGESVSQRNG